MVLCTPGLNLGEPSIGEGSFLINTMGDITDKDREFFEQLANRPADYIREEGSNTTKEEIPQETGLKQVDNEPIVVGPKMPDWYLPHMKNKVGWLNGIPQRPLTKADRRRGKWVDVSQY